MTNPFFKNTGPYGINDLLGLISLKNQSFSNEKVNDIKDLSSSKKGDITFFHSKKYSELASSINASFCITNENLQSFLPTSCKVIISDRILLDVAKITKKFYPNSVTDNFDNEVEHIENSQFKDKVKFGKNVLVGKNIKIGSNCLIGHNSIIETNVSIGDNCTIGSNVIIRNSLIKNNVHILDGCIIGKKGFGFFPDRNTNFRYPQIGAVIIEDNVEIGCSSTIDRGSLSNTVIGKNTFLDNQIHIAHNVKIGENCIIAGQVGFAGSSIIGNNVMIGGQAGISGHLKIGNNVKIGGGSGVIRDIPDNTKVMGYPAKNFKNFLRENK
tara:strand:+ start:721 stop:1698 length:978 start_codon:yes stop_codon:yes gene_type:complete